MIAKTIPDSTAQRICLSSAIGISLGISTLNASTDAFYQAYLPKGVTIGMTPQQVSAARPGAIKNDLQSSSPNAADNRARLEMIELSTEGRSRVAYWYRFKDGTLGAVTRSIMVLTMPVDHAQAGASKIHGDLESDFALKGQEPVLRSNGTENTVLAAQLWEDKAHSLEVYFVATNQEITLTVFDPKRFGKSDFFVGPERRKDFDAQAAAVRSLTENAATPKPVVDLMPAIAGASPILTPPSTPANETGMESKSPSSDSVQTPAATAAHGRTPLWPWIGGLGIAALIVIWKLRG